MFKLSVHGSTLSDGTVPEILGSFGETDFHHFSYTLNYLLKIVSSPFAGKGQRLIPFELSLKPEA